MDIVRAQFFLVPFMFPMVVMLITIMMMSFVILIPMMIVARHREAGNKEER